MRQAAVSVIDDLVTAGVTAVVGGAAALAGAMIGARATRQASIASFEQAVRSEEESWRRALHTECWQNINMQTEQPADGLWSLDTRVLSDSVAHASAFPDEVLQRIIWARTAVAQFDSVVESARRTNLPTEVTAARQEAIRYRNRALGEISSIEVALRIPHVAEPGRRVRGPQARWRRVARAARRI
jgi:hypothetical protein